MAPKAKGKMICDSPFTSSIPLSLLPSCHDASSSSKISGKSCGIHSTPKGKSVKTNYCFCYIRISKIECFYVMVKLSCHPEGSTVMSHRQGINLRNRLQPRDSLKELPANPSTDVQPMESKGKRDSLRKVP